MGVREHGRVMAPTLTQAALLVAVPHDRATADHPAGGPCGSRLGLTWPAGYAVFAWLGKRPSGV